jgi:hypothetical protein
MSATPATLSGMSFPMNLPKELRMLRMIGDKNGIVRPNVALDTTKDVITYAMYVCHKAQ